MPEATLPLSTPDLAAPAAGKRRKWLSIAAFVVIVAALGYGAYWALVLRHYESTDNAYVQGNMVQVTPQIAGTVIAINADDTDKVTAGQTLVKLDPADARVSLNEAEAQLAQTVREVRTLFVGNGPLAATIALRQAEAARAASDVAKAEEDVRRRTPLTATGAVSGEEMEHARATLTSARNLRSAPPRRPRCWRRASSSIPTSRIPKTPTSNGHPNVQRASAKVREAYLALKRSDLPAPVSGYVARRSVQVGQRVQAGSVLMSIVPLDQLWVEANFKEVQLQKIRIGQPVKLVADVYGSKVEYDGRIAGLGAGTGAAFALLPAQNATGNWIKVVQRVPVRISARPGTTQGASPARGPVDGSRSRHRQPGRQEPRGRAAHRARWCAPMYSTSRWPKPTPRISQIIADNAGAAARAAPRGNQAARRGNEPVRARLVKWLPRAVLQRARRVCRGIAKRAGSAITGRGRRCAGGPSAAVRRHPCCGAPCRWRLQPFMNVLDTSIANVSIPAMSGDLGVSHQPGHLGDHLLRGGQCDLRCR